MPAEIADFHRPRDAVDDPLAHRRDADRKEQHAGGEHGGERRLPRNAQALHHRVGEVGVEPHAGRHGDGEVGVEPHQRRAERRGEAGGDEHRAPVHAGLGEDRRVDEGDVDHRHVGRQAGEQLGPDGRAVLLQLEHLAPPRDAHFIAVRRPGEKQGRRALRLRWCRCRSRAAVRRAQQARPASAAGAARRRGAARRPCASRSSTSPLR